MKAYHFIIEYEDFEATICLIGEWSLYDLAESLIDAVGFDFDHCFEFCDNLNNPYKSKERYTLFADIGEEADDPGVKKTLFSSVFTAGKKMLFHFDYGDDWHFPVTCTAIEDSPAKRRSRQFISQKGTAPIQYPNCDEEE
jgi:hypothetical protein